MKNQSPTVVPPPAVFNFESHEVRTVLKDGEPWFVAKDVTDILGYARTRDATRLHCKGAVKYRLLTKGGNQEFILIPERDVYRLIMRSKLPSAEQFEEWVVGTVLPAIRKTGTFQHTIVGAPAGTYLDVLQLAERLGVEPHAVNLKLADCGLLQLDNRTGGFNLPQGEGWGFAHVTSAMLMINGKQEHNILWRDSVIPILQDAAKSGRHTITPHGNFSDIIPQETDGTYYFVELMRRELAKGVQLRALGRLMKIDAAALHNYLYGPTQPRLEKLEKMSRYFGVPITQLLSKDGGQTDEIKLITSSAQNPAVLSTNALYRSTLNQVIERTVDEMDTDRLEEFMARAFVFLSEEKARKRS
jgi:prophage antirepressor-like protein/transcriptional regulator with XRE-family HTH domain